MYTRNLDPKFWRQYHRDCNCGSFALDVAKWFTPYDDHLTNCLTISEREDLIRDRYAEGYSLGCIYEELLENDKIAICQLCPWIEAVEPQDIKDTDRLIAYRLFIDEQTLMCDDDVDEDFHFRVRINGFWFEKCGEEEIRFCGTDDNELPWESNDFLRYDSEIIYFRFRD